MIFLATQKNRQFFLKQGSSSFLRFSLCSVIAIVLNKLLNKGVAGQTTPPESNLGGGTDQRRNRDDVI